MSEANAEYVSKLEDERDDLIVERDELEVSLDRAVEEIEDLKGELLGTQRVLIEAYQFLLKGHSH